MRIVSPQPELTEPQATKLQSLRTDLRRLQGALRLEPHAKQTVSTGIPALNETLPDQGLLRGTLSEWIGAEHGSGVMSLAMRVAGRAQQEGPLIVIDPEQSFYPAAVASAGALLDELILVRPASRKDALWAVEQSLRCPGVGAVVYRVDRLKTQEFRRLQLAAESGTAIGLLVRPPEARRQLGWADVRLLVTPCPATRPRAGHTRDATTARRFRRRLDVRCLYAKGSLADRTVELELCDETGAVCLAAGLSDSASTASGAVRTAGA